MTIQTHLSLDDPETNRAIGYEQAREKGCK